MEKKNKKHGDFSKFAKKDKPKLKKTIKEEPSARSSNLIKKIGDDVKFVRGRSGQNSEIKHEVVKKKSTPKSSDEGGMRLNKYIAHAGVCSRRDADVLILSGVVKVNGVAITELGHKINPTDAITVDDQRLTTEKFQYVLLNKPKDFVTTTKDPGNKRTVMDLVRNACSERIYPVGRLDVKTTGLLLFTNDGDLAKKLTHPKHGITKMYHVFLDKSLSAGDMHSISVGIELEDGIIKPDKIEYVVGGEGKKEVGIQLHSGKNRIVRRIFESLGYKVVKLDRVIFAGLNKKDLPRGRWRMLTQKEIDFLRMI